MLLDFLSPRRLDSVWAYDQRPIENSTENTFCNRVNQLLGLPETLFIQKGRGLSLTQKASSLLLVR
jgi:hypothetical protein